MEFDRFDLEQAIMTAWTGNDDLKILLEMVDGDYSKEDLKSLIIGIKILQEAKIENIFNIFEKGVSEGKIV